MQKCEWERSSDIAVHDQLITGIASNRLPERLLFEGAMLTFYKEVTIVKHYEATLKSLREFSEAEEVKYVRERDR